MYEGLDEFHLQNELLYYFNALCVPIGERIGLIREAHTSKIVGHFGVERHCTICKGMYIGQRCKIKLPST